MTDDDRQLLLDLRRMTDACGAFCQGVLEHNLSRDDQLTLSEWLIGMGECVRERAMRTVVVVDGETVGRSRPVIDGPIEGEVFGDASLVFPPYTVEPDWKL